MRFNVGIIFIVALATLSPTQVQSATEKRLKGTRQAQPGNVKKRGSSRVGHKKPIERRLGKGKGSSSDEDDFTYPCTYCGQGNDSALDATDLSCFSKDATVRVQGIDKPVKMEDLRVGDRVLTKNGVYEQVYSFGHHAPAKTATFLQLYTQNDNPLEMTSDHLVYLADKTNPVRADSVRLGDVLKSSLVGDGDNNVIVQDIQTVEKRGVYAPLTTGGSIVVNDILASSYISLQDTTSSDSVAKKSTLSNEYLVVQGTRLQIPILPHQNFVHMALAPYRMMCRVTKCDITTTTSSTFSGSEGIPTYLSLGIWMNRAASRHLMVHPLAVLLVMSVTGPFWFLEELLLSMNGTSPMLPPAVLAVFLAVVLARRSRVGFVARKVKTA